MKDFKIGLREFEKVLKQALAQTYAYNSKFANESDFKHELFHQLHGMEINGYKLGDVLPGYKTCMLHSEADPIVGANWVKPRQKPKADLLICNPAIEQEYNYKTEIVIELKKDLDSKDLNYEIDKFAGYKGTVRKLYIAEANKPRIEKAYIKRIISERKPPGASIVAFDRSSIPHIPAPQSLRRSRAKTALSGRVAKCIKDTLHLYGDDLTDKFHNFFWRNYISQSELSRPWTFPSEKDFVAQLYHRLRTRLKQSATIRTEYHPPSAPPRKRVDLFVEGASEAVGIEVKMNYNPNNCSKPAVVKALSQKFDAMSNYYANHTNFLVVIQGQKGYDGNAKWNALDRLRQTGSELSLLYYAEHDNKAIGPVSVEEAQGLAMR